MKPTQIHIGLDVDDTQFHGSALLLLNPPILLPIAPCGIEGYTLQAVKSGLAVYQVVQREIDELERSAPEAVKRPPATLTDGAC